MNARVQARRGAREGAAGFSSGLRAAVKTHVVWTRPDRLEPGMAVKVRLPRTYPLLLGGVPSVAYPLIRTRIAEGFVLPLSNQTAQVTAPGGGWPP